MHSALVFYLFSRVQTKQFQPRGSTVLRWSKMGESWTSEFVLCVLFLPPSPNHQGRERQDSFSNIPPTGSKLVFSISTVKSSPHHHCLISSLGSRAPLSRGAVCWSVASFNGIIAAPVAALPSLPSLFTPCQASLTTAHEVLVPQVLPACPQPLNIPSKGTWPPALGVKHKLLCFPVSDLLHFTAPNLLCVLWKFQLCCVFLSVSHCIIKQSLGFTFLHLRIHCQELSPRSSDPKKCLSFYGLP